MNSSPQHDPRTRLLQRLRGQLGEWEAAPPPDAELFSSGTPALDRLLPAGGLRHGMLVEWLDIYKTGDTIAGLPSAPATLSLLAAREACRAGGVLVVVDRRRTFYPPAAASWGIQLNRLIVAHPRTARDELWSVLESLRSPVVAAVWVALDRLADRAFRQLQLAAQAGRTLGLLLRPAAARNQPSWADVRLAVAARQGDATRQGDKERGRQGETSTGIFSLSPCLPLSLSASSPRCALVRVLRCRHGRPGGAAWLDIDDVMHTVQEGSRLSAVGYQQARLADSRFG